MQRLFSEVRADGYLPHALHSSERIWPETNCYVDLWIEVLAALKLEPRAMLGFTLTQDFEGDQFTFFKVPLEDLELLYDIRVSELAIYASVINHVQMQLSRGRLCLIEVDGFFLPDTAGTGYRSEHGKTTIAINALDEAARHIEYFHNAGYHMASGDDFDGLFQRSDHQQVLPLLPYSEFAKLPLRLPSTEALRAQSLALFHRHFARRPEKNPIASFGVVYEQQAQELFELPFDAFHKYAFNTLRQFGANFELLASHLEWLFGKEAAATAIAASLSIAECAKTSQFQLARAVTRKKSANLASGLEPAIVAWDALMAELSNLLQPMDSVA